MNSRMARTVAELYGERTVDAIGKADRIEWFRIDPKTRGVGDGIEGFRIAKVGPVVRPPEMRSLVDFLLTDETYGWGAASACKPTPGVAARLRSGTLKVLVIFCFECDEMQVVLREQGGREANLAYHNFRPGRSTLVTLVKQMFPKDREIMSLSQAPRVLKRQSRPARSSSFKGGR